jgi:hypothetical protein
MCQVRERSAIPDGPQDLQEPLQFRRRPTKMRISMKDEEVGQHLNYWQYSTCSLAGFDYFPLPCRPILTLAMFARCRSGQGYPTPGEMFLHKRHYHLRLHPCFGCTCLSSNSATRSKRIRGSSSGIDVCICFRSLIGVLLGPISGS